jgi:hypothetical protein
LSRRRRWEGHVAWGRGGIHRKVGRPEGKRSLGRHRNKWEDYIRMDLVSLIGWDGMD